VKFQRTEVIGVWLIDALPKEDDRGLFARTFCRNTFREAGLEYDLPQCSTSFNKRRGTLRGMHLQSAPYEETKVVRCTRGRILDVVVDLRPDSPSFLAWNSVELSADNRKSMYIPKGCAHGFQTLEDNAELFYMISDTFHPASARGVRWNDPAIRIRWPIAEMFMSDRDKSWPDFAVGQHDRR
jgi:dTDP-4-dehydrorhamnose 3,5-epimerase